MPKRSSKQDLLPGTLDMLVLHTLSIGQLHGYAIAQHLGQVTDGTIRIEQGSLYPALERLQNEGLIKSKWGISPTGRKVRYYNITASGRRELGKEVSSFDSMLLAISRVLGRASS